MILASAYSVRTNSCYSETLFPHPLIISDNNSRMAVTTQMDAHGLVGRCRQRCRACACISGSDGNGGGGGGGDGDGDSNGKC